MPTCANCPGRRFNTAEALSQHKLDSKGHFYCATCVEDFADRNALFDHAATAHMTTCGSCRRMFNSVDGLVRHLFDSPKHPKCRLCRMGFRDYAEHALHKAEVHGKLKSPNAKRRSPNSNLKRDPNSRLFSPVTSTDNSSPSSPLLRSQSVSSSVIAGIRDTENIVQKMLPSSQNGKDEIRQRKLSPLQSFAHVPRRVGSPHSSSTTEPEKNGQMVTHGPQSSSDAKKSSQRDVHGRSPSPHSSDASVPRPGSTHLDVPAESGDEYEPDRSPLKEASTFAGMRFSFSSPLLEENVPLSSDSGSDLSADGEVRLRYANEWARPRSSSPCLHQESARHGDGNDLPSRGRLVSPTPTHSASKVTDTMRAAWRARCAAATRSGSPRRLGSPPNINTARTFSQLSRLPTISDESEVDQELEFEYDSESLTPLVTNALPEVQQFKRPVGSRRRRLSLSPTLSSIPETAYAHGLGTFSPNDLCDSDSDSSQGIFEHNAEDFLYDSLSENERCQTPMTYLTADDLEFELEEDVGQHADDQRTCLQRGSDCPSSPTLLVEDLTELAREMCSPSTADGDFDPFADPFNLHPSANNSPMNASFPRRPRAWSVGAPGSDTTFLLPVVTQSGSEDTVQGKEEGRPEYTADKPEACEEEIDEAAIAADESPPTVIEDDLFSEPDQIMEPIPQDTVPADPVTNNAETGFAEDGHPLRSIVSLDTLPPSPTARRQSNLSLLSSGEQCGLRAAAVTEPAGLEIALNRKPPLYCRLCQADPCEEVTATFCGHIFCNGCITREVMARSKCPVCSTPTLLYCLFKLDLRC